jgi:hypothetical protein
MQHPSLRVGRRLNRAAGILAGAVLLDSTTEHYRGSFHNKAMIAPLIASTLSLIASMHGTSDRRTGAHIARDAVYALAGTTGLIGTAFHLFNIGKRPGGISWLNLFYGAPVAAPAALSLSGLLGFLAERARESHPEQSPTILGLPAGRVISGLAAVGLLVTAAEAGLFHFRGAYHDKAMFLPVSIPPAAAIILVDAAGPRWLPRQFARGWLRLTAWLGFAGVGFHTFGIARNMGGWRNWSQNLLNGPPIPAPPSFTGLALAGLAAIDLMSEHPDA